MNKCQKCGKENVPLFNCSVGSNKINACFGCLAIIENERSKREIPANCLKRKRVLH